MTEFNITNIPEVSVYSISPITGIVHVRYNTRYELCSSFMRLQEFYESDLPGIQGNVFSLEQYMDAYAKRNGGFSYTMDWSGFNIPSNIFHLFIHHYRDSVLDKLLLDKEKILIDAINAQVNAVLPSDATFYIIGSYKDCVREASVIQHEVAHALYNLDLDYKYHADIACNVLPDRDAIIDVLKEWGYSGSVIHDEVQAYASTNCNADWKSFPGVNTDDKEFIEVLGCLKAGLNAACKKHGITLPKPHTNKARIKLEKEYRAKYGYNAGEMI